jgi:hypothetical protein
MPKAGLHVRKTYIILPADQSVCPLRRLRPQAPGSELVRDADAEHIPRSNCRLPGDTLSRHILCTASRYAKRIRGDTDILRACVESWCLRLLGQLPVGAAPILNARTGDHIAKADLCAYRRNLPKSDSHAAIHSSELSDDTGLHTPTGPTPDEKHPHLITGFKLQPISTTLSICNLNSSKYSYSSALSLRF